jgi:hypothetical protein
MPDMALEFANILGDITEAERAEAGTFLTELLLATRSDPSAPDHYAKVFGAIPKSERGPLTVAKLCFVEGVRTIVLRADNEKLERRVYDLEARAATAQRTIDKAEDLKRQLAAFSLG